MKKKPLLNLYLLGVLCFFIAGSLFAETEIDSTYGHISFVDKSATVIRQDKSEHTAITNLPVAPGDQVLTGDNGRCEIQFDNGTVIRLDKNSRLRVTTIMAPTLTTSWKVTTLHLMRGQIYAMVQSYNKEMFQVITPNVAIDLKKRTATTIQLKDNGDTFFFSDKGKYPVLFGEKVRDIKSDTVKPKQGYLVTSDHHFKKTTEKRDLEFLSWNDYVNRNFKDLHYGISKIPKKIYKYPKGIVYWAEKWSSLYGEWVYDDVFGYVWKPADEIFAFSKRPFFHANFTTINGQLFLVPQQSWGWVPAHMGTWVWMKWGWTWVPGDAFTSGFSSIENEVFPVRTLDYYIGEAYGGYSLWYVYCTRGRGEWVLEYRRSFNADPDNLKSTLKTFPSSVRGMISKLNKTSIEKIKAKLGDNRPNSMIERHQVESILKSMPGQRATVQKKTSALKAPVTLSKTAVIKNNKSIAVNSQNRKLSHTAIPLNSRNNKKVLQKGVKINSPAGFRDFNPDKKWAYQKGYRVGYSSKLNAVVCPNLKINSRNIPPHLRNTLRNSSSPNFNNRKGYYSGVNSSSSQVTTGSITPSRVSSNTSTKSSNSGGTVTKKK